MATLLDDDSQFDGLNSDDGGDSSDSEGSECSDVPPEKYRLSTHRITERQP